MTGNMIVTGMVAGTNKIPDNLSDNTIYVLGTGVYVETGTTNMGNCTAIVGSGTVTISSNYVTDARLLQSTSKTNWILDNLKLNRNRTGGLYTDDIYSATSPSTTVNNIQTYSGNNGMYFYGSLYAFIYNSQSYNNAGYGIYFHK